MEKRVEFFFDVGSPTTYLAWTQLPALCRQTGATLAYRPMLLGGVFQATGNASPVSVPAKGRYMFDDMNRYAGRYGVPFRMNSHFPINTLTLMRAATGVLLRTPQRLEDFLRAVFEALWVQGLNLNDAELTAQCWRDGGFDPGQVAEAANDPATKAALRATTEEAVARGVFGAPTFFVADRMFFGQDRMDWVREALG